MVHEPSVAKKTRLRQVASGRIRFTGIQRILRHGRTIHSLLLAALGKVSYEDVEGLRKFAALENVLIPFFTQDLLRHIMETNRPSDEQMQQVIPA